MRYIVIRNIKDSIIWEDSEKSWRRMDTASSPDSSSHLERIRKMNTSMHQIRFRNPVNPVPEFPAISPAEDANWARRAHHFLHSVQFSTFPHS